MRRLIKKQQAKDIKEHFYTNFKECTRIILHKFEIGEKPSNTENAVMGLFGIAYMYRDRPRSEIIQQMHLKAWEDPGYPMLYETAVQVYFDMIHHLVTEKNALGQKIICCWNENLYEEKELKKIHELTLKIIEEVPGFCDNIPKDFDTFKKNAGIENLNVNNKVSFDALQIYHKYGIGFVSRRTETEREYMKRKYSDPKFREKQIKSILDSLPNTDDPTSILAVNDMLTYRKNPNQFQNEPNYMVFLKELENSKHPILEQLIEKAEFQKWKHQNPIVLNEDAINFPPEQVKKTKYRQIAEKR